MGAESLAGRGRVKVVTGVTRVEGGADREMAGMGLDSADHASR